MQNRFESVDAAIVVAVFVFFAVLAHIVDYSGEFPINDDWGFSTPLYWYSTGEGVHLTYWQSMPYLTQLGVAMVWTDLFGFGYEILRSLTLLQSAIVVACTFALGRIVGLGSGHAALLAFCFVASPVFMGLSFTFMSDIGGLSFTLGACLLLGLSMQNGDRSFGLFLAGGFVLLCAVALRQNSLSVGIAFVIAQFLFIPRPEARVAGGFLLLIAGGTLYAFIPSFMEATVGVPGDYGLETLGMINLLGDLASFRLGALIPAFEAALHLYVGAGILLLPIAPFILARLMGGWGKPVAALLAAIVVTGLSFLFDQQALSGAREDILSPYGIGPRLILGGAPPAPLVSLALTLAGTLVTTAILICLIEVVRKLWRNGTPLSAQGRVSAFFILSGLGIYAPHGLTYGPLMDRYWITPTILISVGALGLILGREERSLQASKAAFTLSVMLVTTGIVLSAAMTEDFFRWQRARYALADRAHEEFGASIETFSGGFEYDNLVRIIDEPDAAKSIEAVRLKVRPLYLAHPTWPDDEVIATEPVDRILPLGPKIVTLRSAGRPATD